MPSGTRSRRPGTGSSRGHNLTITQINNEVESEFEELRIWKPNNNDNDWEDDEDNKRATELWLSVHAKYRVLRERGESLDDFPLWALSKLPGKTAKSSLLHGFGEDHSRLLLGAPKLHDAQHFNAPRWQLILFFWGIPHRHLKAMSAASERHSGKPLPVIYRALKQIPEKPSKGSRTTAEFTVDQFETLAIMDQVEPMDQVEHIGERNHGHDEEQHSDQSSDGNSSGASEFDGGSWRGIDDDDGDDDASDDERADVVPNDERDDDIPDDFDVVSALDNNDEGNNVLEAAHEDELDFHNGLEHDLEAEKPDNYDAEIDGNDDVNVIDVRMPYISTDELSQSPATAHFIHHLNAEGQAFNDKGQSLNTEVKILRSGARLLEAGHQIWREYDLLATQRNLIVEEMENVNKTRDDADRRISETFRSISDLDASTKAFSARIELDMNEYLGASRKRLVSRGLNDRLNRKRRRLQDSMARYLEKNPTATLSEAGIGLES